MAPRNLFGFWLLASLMAGTMIAGCGGSDTPKIEGKWKILSALGDGREMSTGDDWFEFKADGQAMVKVAGPEEKGTWRTEPEKSTLIVKSEAGPENRYDYRFSQDTLLLKTVVGKSHELQFVCIRAQ